VTAWFTGLFIKNGWYIPKTIETRNEKIIGLLRVFSDYGFENDLIESGFEKDFRLPGGTQFSTDKGKSEFHIFNREGEFIFTLIFSPGRPVTSFIIIPFALWIIALILAIIITLKISAFLARQNKNIAAAGFCLLIFVLIYFIILVTGKPSVFYVSSLFSPYNYTINRLVPSLGHLLTGSVLLTVFSRLFMNYFPVEKLKETKLLRNKAALLTLLLIPSVLLFLLHNLVFSHIVYASNISFETYKVVDINGLSIVGYASVILLLLGVLFYLMKIFRAIDNFTFRDVALAAIISALLFPLVYFSKPLILIPSLLFYLIMVPCVWITEKRRSGIFNRTVIFSLIFGLWSLYVITKHSEQKATENLKIQAVAFSTENDPEAEHHLIDLWPVISADSYLENMMRVDYFGRDDFDNIFNYLYESYFDGYLGNYNFNIVLCRSDESLRIGQADEVFRNCFEFFDDRILRDGNVITGTGFYSVDHQMGRAYYLGKLLYPMTKGITNGLFMELYSDINIFQPGYPELLLDKRYYGYSRIRDYSFAKYIDGEIVLRTGDFPYNKTDVSYVGKSIDYRQFRQEKFSHILYRNGNVTVIISKPLLTAGDLVISFAYLFTFLFLFSNLVMLLIRRPVLRSPWNLNFRQKLQMSFISVLLFSFILIGIITTSLTVSQYRERHYKDLKEKLNSVYLELDNILSREKHLTPEWRNGSYNTLDEILIDLSNIVNTDINLYDKNGYLLATSRPEIFHRNLASRRMHNTAFLNLRNITREYYQEEKIGNLQYISAYVPYYNDDNELLAYLNLPYFRMQSVLAKEISNLIVAVINLTLLLIVATMSLAVFISSRLTSPLSMLSIGLASVKLGKKSEPLAYKSSDEIGELVGQYNMMLEELDESAKKLTESEREYAWREMARQIAHEIKNPLTPMKLNVQQLLKSWKDGAPGFEKKLERFTRNQIEYIDNLSSIASAFSAFAKMPEAKPVEVDLLEQIRTTLELFKSSENITFRIGWPREKRIFIYADKEHLNGVFSNLIKNGIQSIPHGREGVIRVNIETTGNKVVISVADNGSGIPESLRDKMFTPNFTTKSSGMGLGLSIVKRYVESANGRIWFESEIDNGSVFYIEYPLMYSVFNRDNKNAIE